MSWIVVDFSGAPLTTKRPPSHSRSSSEASSRWAAIFCAFARMRRDDHRGRRPGDRRRAARVRAEAVGRVVGVALLHVDVLGLQAELLGDDLRERRLVALALRLDAQLQHGLAGRVDAELGAVVHAQAGDLVLGAVAGADDLGERREADADQPALRTGLGLLAAKVGVPELLEREVHGRLVVARVVLEPGRRLVRELLRLDEVLPPEVRRVDRRARRPPSARGARSGTRPR